MCRSNFIILTCMFIGLFSQVGADEPVSFSLKSYQASDDQAGHLPKEEFYRLRIYEIMVSAFIDGDSTRDYNVGYGPSHHRGDLKGVIKALTYIKSLGMNAIWLTPIFDSDKGSGNDPKLESTGYFAHDYFKIDPNFGTFEEAKALVDKAHQLGMYVFFDGVFGHHKGTVAPSPSGRKPASSKRRAKYPGSLKFYEEVATYWIDTLGIDGWRLDQAQQVPVQYWEEIRQAVEATCRERYAAGKKWGTLGYMVAEVWAGETDIARQAYGNRDSVGLYSAFDFPVRYRLVQCLAVEESGKGRKPASILAEGYATHQVYPHHAIPNLMLSSHDLVRFGDLIQRAGLSGKENPHYWKRHQCAFSFMAAYTGPITIYYNDEIGYELEGFAKRVTERCWEKNLCDDHVSRTPGKISGLTTKEQDLKNYVARLMRFRDVHPALWKGKRTNLIATEHIYADLKEFDGDRILYILNVSPQERTVSLSQSILGTQILIDSDDHKKIMAADGEFRIHLPGLCGQFFIVE